MLARPTPGPNLLFEGRSRLGPASAAGGGAALSRVAIALSGGGHRACLFALGALLYLADARRNADVTSIASVSGGSLANGAVAQQLDYKSAPPAELETVAARVARQVAGPGTVLASPLTWIYLAVVAVAFVLVVVGTWFLPIAAGLKALVFVAGLVAFGWLIALRGAVAGRAFARTLFSPAGGSARLRDISVELDHVFCATDLHAGEHVYFSGRFVCAYRFGLGEPADLPLHAAVQASAAFPGVFPVAWLPTARHRFQSPASPEAAKARRMALHDGGVYDNMADQWAQGLARRSARWEALEPGFQDADELVVVNGSAGLDWRSVGRLRLPLVGELFTLLRDKSVLYDNGNSLRRAELVARFDLAEREGRGLRGALVHIPQSPFDVPERFSRADGHWPERAERARAALACLGEGGAPPDEARAHWRQVACENAAVKTTLVALGRPVSARLLHHAYVLAMVNLHVILGYPLLAVPGRERFDALLEEPAAA